MARVRSGVSAGTQGGSKGAASIEVVGLDELLSSLNSMAVEDIPKTIAATVYGIASDLRKRVRSRVPVKSGSLKKSIRVKRRKSTPMKPVVDLWFDPKGGWYWRLVEHGHGGPVASPAHPFVAPSVEEARAMAPTILRVAMQKAIDKRIRANAKRAAKQ